MKPSILVQLDTDPQPSVFDGVVAVDAGVQHLFRHGGVTPDKVTGLVHGAMFTRGPADLARTALFIGGSDVNAAEALLHEARAAFFGPFRVSVLFDPNGSNTTAAAAVLAALQGLEQTRGEIAGATVAVLAATGPVGQRAARLLLGLPGDLRVRVGSRALEKAQAVADGLAETHGRTPLPFATATPDALARGLEGADVVIAAGAAGVQLASAEQLRASGARVFIDLNAVPPAGLAGIEPGDKRADRHGGLAWGALGVGGTKMKIHRRAIERLFTANDQVIDAEQCLAIGREL